MSHSLTPSTARAPVWRGWIGAALALTLAIGSSLLAAQLLMAPPAGDIRDLAVYLSLSGVVTLAAGWIAVRTIDRVAGLSLPTKSFLATAAGSAVALLNIVIVAQLMFVSTGHDFKLLLALIAFSAVVTVFFTLWVASTTVRRLEAIAALVRRLAAGDYAARLDASGRDEVARLARDVNSLAGRLHAAEEERTALALERQELTSSIAHDLRTPLASVRAMVEALDDRVVTDDVEVRRYYATIRREIERLNRMIGDLFELAQIDAGALRLDTRPVALQEIVTEVVDAMQAQARVAGVSLAFHVDSEPPEIALDGARIERALANLVRNAIEHTPSGGSIDVRVACLDREARISVADTGDGIAPADLPHIWTRFYRADKSRNRPDPTSDGAGLGLAITRGIIESHGGTIAVRSEPGRGAEFTARLPVG
ncbi:MAG: HAMP domain-containing histidine kinase [Chloroflexi bacterium]|nr:HAMP domain-containing histidine kinase [Chloroflexota bacterium]